MSDDMEHVLDTEQQRAQAQNRLRVAKKALVLTIGEDGTPAIDYININDVEYRGLVELLKDVAPKWRELDGEG